MLVYLIMYSVGKVDRDIFSSFLIILEPRV